MAGMASLILVLGLLALTGAFRLWSSGRPAPVVDEHGRRTPDGISEKVFVDINGVRQGMIIRGRHRSNPILLFVHGGPGMPEYFLSETYPTGLEDDFTVVWWDQRGAGLSYHPGIPLDSMTLDQLTADTITVTNYLRARFGVEKVYLMAHSAGSTFAIQAAARAPELFYAYIGVGQVTHQRESELLAYAFMLDAYRKAGDTRMVRRLEGAEPRPGEPLPAAYLALRDEAMHRLGVGSTRDMRSVVTGIFLPSLRTRQYTLSEKVQLWRGKAYSARALRDDVFSLDVRARVRQLRLPVYFFHGIHDYTCSYPMAKAYLDSLSAPVKGFYTFSGSAHSPIFEEPHRVRAILRKDVLQGTNSLADPRPGTATPHEPERPEDPGAGAAAGAPGWGQA